MAPKAKAAAAAPAQPAAKAKPEPKKKAPKKEYKPEDEIPKVPQPDAEAFKEKVAKVTADIEKLNKEQAALSAQINERSGGKTEFFAQKAALRAQLDEVSQKMDALQAEKEEISRAVGDEISKGREMKQELNKMKKSIGYTNEVDIDERIASIEFKLWTESVPLKEEKKYLAEIADLKKSRPKVAKLREMEAGVQSMDFSRGASMQEKRGLINEQMAKHREEKRGISEQLTKLTEARKEQLGDLPKVIEKRDEFSKQIQEKIRERNEIRDAYREEERAYYAYQAELRKLRQEKQQQEREAWQAEQDKQRKLKAAEKLDEQPFVDEITLVEQTIKFCRGLTKEKETEQKEETKATVVEMEGAEVLTKKEDRDEYYFVPTAKGKKNKAKGKSAKEGASKAIKHNAMTFGFFSQLKIDAPITTDDIPAVLEKLEALLEEFKQKVKKWEATRDAKKAKILAGTDYEEEAEAKEEAKEEEAKEEEAKEEAKEDSKEEEADAES